MFRRPNRDALYERIIAEKDAQIEWLRAQLGRPTMPAALNPSELPDHGPAELGDAGWVSEAEEARAILAETGLSNHHLPEILDGLGYGNSDL